MNDPRFNALTVLLVSGDADFISKIQSLLTESQGGSCDVAWQFQLSISTKMADGGEHGNGPSDIVIVDGLWSGLSAPECASRSCALFETSSVIVAMDLDNECHDELLESYAGATRVQFVSRNRSLASLSLALRQFASSIVVRKQKQQLLCDWEHMAERIARLQQENTTLRSQLGELIVEDPDSSRSPSKAKPRIQDNRIQHLQLEVDSESQLALAVTKNSTADRNENSSVLADEAESCSIADECRISGRVLLAEDVPCNRRLLCFLLERAGAEVVAVEDGAAALDAIQSSGPFDLVLMDMIMPKMDGYECCRELRARNYDGPLIAITSRSLPSDRQLCLDAGCDGYLIKPVDRNLLIRTVGRYLDESRGVGEQAAEANSLEVELVALVAL